ncbi:hypothetical protein Lal_00037564, partial [Lupinus albus]
SFTHPFIFNVRLHIRYDFAIVDGLRRSSKSCRLRWQNYLHPNLKHDPFSVEEKQLIIQLQQLWVNKVTPQLRCDAITAVTATCDPQFKSMKSNITGMNDYNPQGFSEGWILGII